MVPKTRLSDELDRLSPITHSPPLGTVTGPKSDVCAMSAIIQPPTEKSRKPSTSANANAGRGHQNRGLP